MNERRPIRSPPNDPNRTQNRIPSPEELVTLRNIRSNRRKLADYTKQELDMAREAHERIQSRYDKIMREMESIQSELNLSHDYLITLEKQFEMSQAEDERLAGLLHPIRRCPEEILVLIFDATELEGSTQFSFATTVSQVCRSWRAAALTASSLWRNIDISMNKTTQDIKTFVECCRIRLGSAVPNITIRHIFDRPIDVTEDIMAAVGLEDFENVDTLNYILNTSKDITQLTYSAFDFSPSSIQRLYIRAETRSEGSATWDCACLLRRCSNIGTLELEDLGSVALGGDDSFPMLRVLNLHNVEMSGMALHLARYSRLEEIILTGEAFTLQPLLQDINLQMLSVLEINSPIQGFPWSRLTAPNLRRLNTADASEACSAFIYRHPSIVNLDYCPWAAEGVVNNFARSLGSLEALFVWGSIDELFRQTDTEAPFPPFPKLKELFIDTTAGHPLALQNFEDFTRLRLRPQQTQVHGDGVERITNFVIYIPTKDLNLVPWRKSLLMAQWKETIKKDKGDGSMTKIELVPAE